MKDKMWTGLTEIRHLVVLSNGQTRKSCYMRSSKQHVLSISAAHVEEILRIRWGNCGRHIGHGSANAFSYTDGVLTPTCQPPGIYVNMCVVYTKERIMWMFSPLTMHSIFSDSVWMLVTARALVSYVVRGCEMTNTGIPVFETRNTLYYGMEYWL